MIKERWETREAYRRLQKAHHLDAYQLAMLRTTAYFENNYRVHTADTMLDYYVVAYGFLRDGGPWLKLEPPSMSHAEVQEFAFAGGRLVNVGLLGTKDTAAGDIIYCLTNDGRQRLSDLAYMAGPRGRAEAAYAAWARAPAWAQVVIAFTALVAGVVLGKVLP